MEQGQVLKTVLMMNQDQAAALVQLLRMERETDPMEFDRSELGKILLAMAGGP